MGEMFVSHKNFMQWQNIMCDDDNQIYDNLYSFANKIARKFRKGESTKF